MFTTRKKPPIPRKLYKRKKAHTLEAEIIYVTFYMLPGPSETVAPSEQRRPSVYAKAAKRWHKCCSSRRWQLVCGPASSHLGDKSHLL